MAQNVNIMELLDSAQPWSHESDGAPLLDAVAAFIRRFIVLRSEQADACALWTMHTHAIDAADIENRPPSRLKGTVIQTKNRRRRYSHSMKKGARIQHTPIPKE